MFSDPRRASSSLPARVLRACVAAAMVVIGLTATVGPAHASVTVQHLAVPAYFNPGASPGSTYWTRLGQGAPAVGISVANPASGPGTAFDQTYANAIQAAARSGIKVIGYVDTGYFGTTGRTTRGGQTSASAWTTQVQGDVDNWYRWYGGYGLAGIFFDDAQNVCGSGNAYVNLYIAINTYTKQNHAGALTVDNPGAPADQCYSSAADILVMFEGTYASYTSWSAPSWELGSDPNKFWHLVYATSTQADMENAVALSKQRGAGYLYVTNDVLPNPWDTLPTGSYWTDELARTGAGGGGDTTAPAAPTNVRVTNVGSTSVTLGWTAATDDVGVTGYDAYAGSTRATTVPGNTTTATVEGLHPGTTYSFSVTARDAAGNISPASAPASATTTTGGGMSCTTTVGSGDITAYSACMDTAGLRFRATFNTAVSLHHVFINSDGNTATGYQLPSPSTSRLGADYMIENNTLYKSACACWGWTAVNGVSPNMTASDSTYTWTVPLSALTNPAATQQAEFNGNTSYTPVITYGRG
jgi:chitodextrinase